MEGVPVKRSSSQGVAAMKKAQSQRILVAPKSVRFREGGKSRTKLKKVMVMGEDIADPCGIVDFLIKPLHPASRFMQRWKDVSIFFLGVSLFRLPFYMAFGGVHVLSTFLWNDLYFLIDNLIALNCGFQPRQSHTTPPVMDRRSIVLRYFSWSTFRSGDRWCFYVFLMEYGPFYAAVLLCSLYAVPDWVITVCAIPRARRLWDLFTMWRRIELEADSKYLRRLAVIKYAMLLAGGTNAYGCLWWGVARLSGFPDTCWVVQFLQVAKRPINHASFVTSHYNYFLSLYWGVLVLSNLEFSNYAALNYQEFVLATFSIFLQVVIFSYLLGILLNYIVRKDAREEKYNALMVKVERYAKMHDLPRKIEDAIKMYFTFQYTRRIGEHEELLAAIPASMRSKIQAERYQLVASNPIFTGCSEQFVTAVLALLRPKILIPGSTIFHRDDMAREVFFIESGEVEVYGDEPAPFRLVSCSDSVACVVGEVAFFLGVPQPYAHRASSKSHVKLLALSKEDYEDVKDSYPDSRDTLINNVKARVGLGPDNEPLGGDVTKGTTTTTTTTQQALSSEEVARAVELRQRVALGIRKKLEDDLASMLNAINEGDIETVKLLVDRGFKLQNVDYDKRGVLHYAAAKGCDEIVEFFIQRGVDVHTRDRWGHNALQNAVEGGHQGVVARLAAQGSELRLSDPAGKLCTFAADDNLYELQRLIENGIDCNSALHLAAYEGNNKVLEYLLLPSNKCNFEATDRWGVTPLFEAIKHGNSVAARLLYETGARLSEGKGAPFLCSAAAKGDGALLRMMDECEVETNVGDYDKRYPLHLAAAEGELVALDFLMFAKADVTVRDRWGRTAVDDALLEGHWDCAKLLINNGAPHGDISPEAQRALDAVDLVVVRTKVADGKVEQERRHGVVKALRETVKRMGGDLRGGLTSLDERCDGLQRVVDRLVEDEQDDEQIARAVAAFFKQPDAVILVPDRPSRNALPAAVMVPGGVGAEDYMLNRFLCDTSPTSAMASPASEAQRGANIKTMQHFLMQLTNVELALTSWKEALEECSVGGDDKMIDKTGLESALRAIGAQCKAEEVTAVYGNCLALRRSFAGKDEEEGGAGGDGKVEEKWEGAAAGGSSSSSADCVTLTSVLSSMAVWDLIERSPGAEAGKGLDELQEALGTVRKGYLMMAPRGALSKADWLQRKQSLDMGDFAVAMDDMLADRATADYNTFFLVVAKWAGMFGEVVLKRAESRVKVAAAARSPVRLSLNLGARARSPSCPALSVPVDSQEGSAAKPVESMATPASNGDSLGEHVKDSFRTSTGSLSSAWGYWWLRRRLHDMVSRMGEINISDVRKNFHRLDTEQSGWLDLEKVELLLSWSFDMDLTPDEWSLLLTSLSDSDEETGARQMVSLSSVEALCKNLNSSAARRAANKQMLSQAWVFDNKGPFIRVWMEIMGVVALYYFLSVTYVIAFLRDALLTEYVTSLNVSYAFDCMTVINVIIKLNTSFIDSSSSVRVTDRRRIRQRYLMTQYSADLIGILPLDIFARFLGATPQLVAWLRLPKLIFCHYLYTFFNRKRLSSSSRLMANVEVLLLLSWGIVHVMACVLFMITYGQVGTFVEIKAYTGLGDYINEPNGGGPFRIEYYLYCFMSTLHNIVGIWALPMERIPELIFTMVLCIMNLSAWAYLMGSISGLCVKDDETIAESHKLMSDVTHFIQNERVPPSVSEELKNYFNVNAQQQRATLSLAEQKEIYRALPLALQVDVSRIISRDLLRSVQIFEDMSAHFLEAISVALDQEVFCMGDSLFKTDDTCRTLYIVASGKVQVTWTHVDSRNSAVRTSTEVCGQGSALGQLEFLFGIRYMTSAHVAGSDDVYVFRLGKEQFARIVKLYPADEDILYQNLSRLASEHNQDSASFVGSQMAPSVISATSSIMSDAQADVTREKALDKIERAQRKSKEQRIRSFCNAAAMGDMDTVQRLIKTGVDVNGTDCEGRTALMLAACAGKMDVVRYLLLHGAKPNIKDKVGGSAISDAVRQAADSPSHLDIVVYLHQHGATLSLPDPAGELCQAAADGNLIKLKNIVELGVSPNVADYDKRTPLHLAASEGHVDCVQLLLSHWADVNAVDRMGGTPLMDAVRHGHSEVQQLLLRYGGLLKMDPVELGAMLCTAAAEGDRKTLETLVQNGADINQGDYDFRTALHLAVCCNKLEVIPYLVKLPSIDVNPVDRLGNTPLDDAIREGHVDLVSVLQVRGGLSGKDASVGGKLKDQSKQRKNRLKVKQLRRGVALSSAKHRVEVLERLTAIYDCLEHLPTLSRYTNLVAMTLRSRHSPSTLDRSPMPTLTEARQYFFDALTQFLSRVHKPHYEAFLTLTEAYAEAEVAFPERQNLAKNILDRFFSPESFERLNFDPNQVTACKAQYRAGLDKGSLSPNLFEPFRASVEQIVEGLLPEFGRSTYYREACSTGRGVLWRVVKISRLSLQLIDELMSKSVEPFLVMYDRDHALECVPHYSPKARTAFRADFVHLKASLIRLKGQLKLAGYMAKRDSKHEEHQRMLKEHSKQVTTAARGLAHAFQPKGEVQQGLSLEEEDEVISELGH